MSGETTLNSDSDAFIESTIVPPLACRIPVAGLQESPLSLEAHQPVAFHFLAEPPHRVDERGEPVDQPLSVCGILLPGHGRKLAKAGIAYRVAVSY